MNGLQNKRILLGVTGGIAAYKSADLVRRLRSAGADVRVVMTQAATAFVGPLTFQALSGHPVHTGLLDAASEAAMDHISLARWPEAIIIAPASADMLARLAHGHASDLLTTLCLASTAPLWLAPAMNHQMWGHPATQENFRTLLARGVRAVGPDAGEQACGEVGEGRMAEPMQIVDALSHAFTPGLLSGRRVVITAGPTREALDPVRVLTNRSSGKMGFAVAMAAIEQGAEVTLIAGPVALATPASVKRIDVQSAAEMMSAVQQAMSGCDIFIGAAAVADYCAEQVAEQKIKKDADRLVLSLVRTPDILAQVAALSTKPFTVGFAAESTELERHALDKLSKKNLDMIAANWISGPQSALESDDNALQVYWLGGSAKIERNAKSHVARQLVDLIAQRYSHKVRGGNKS